MTQQAVADQLGIDRSSYARYEIGTREPDFDTLQRLANIFKVSIDYLVGRSIDPAQISGDDAELWELRETLRRRPGMRILFSATKDATEADILKAVKIIEALKGDPPDAD